MSGGYVNLAVSRVFVKLKTVYMIMGAHRSVCMGMIYMRGNLIPKLGLLYGMCEIMQQLAKREFLRTEFAGVFNYIITFAARDINEESARFFLYYNPFQSNWWISDINRHTDKPYAVSHDIMMYFVGETQYDEMKDKVESIIKEQV